MFCPFAGWCFVLNMRKLVHWEGAPFSQIPATHYHSCHRHAFLSCEVKYKPFSLLCSSSSQAELLVMCDMGSLPKLFLIPVPPQNLWYCVQVCLYINLWLMYNYFSRSLILTIRIQHSILFCIMGKCSLMNWSPSSFHGSQWIFFLYCGRAVQNLHPITLLAQQHSCAWFTAEERRDGHPY